MIKKFLWAWFPLAISGTIILLVVYVAVQQAYRQGANDPQIELVENASRALSAGFPSQALFANALKLEMSQTLSMFIMVFDESGNLVESSVTNGGMPPAIPPIGLFDYVRENGQDRITWEPASGLRYAAVVDHFATASSSGFILAARSLREVEIREANLSWMILFGWVAFILVSAATCFVGAIMKPLPEVS